jgi:hypothetical protein
MEYAKIQYDFNVQHVYGYCLPEQNEQDCRIRDELCAGKKFPSDYVYPIALGLGSPSKILSDIGVSSSAFAVSQRMQDIISLIAADQVQFIPIHHGPHPDAEYQVSQSYAWLNVLNRVPCLEFIKGETLTRRPKLDLDPSRWTPRDPAPILKEIRFYPEKVEGLHIFRPDEWPSAVIISSVLQEAFVKAGLIGLACEPMKEWLVSKRKTSNSMEGFYPGVS